MRSSVRLVTILVWIVVLGRGPTPLMASERSEVLTARGEVAYHRGDLAGARHAADEALAADAADAEAHLLLGRVLLAGDQRNAAEQEFEEALRLQPDLAAAREGLAFIRSAPSPGPAGGPAPRTVGELEPLAAVRSGSVGRRWGLHFTTGVQYDSNVTLVPHGQYPQGSHGDAAFILAGGGHYDVLDRPDTFVRVEYDLYQTLHPSLTDFDFRSHEMKATGSYALTPALWIGVRGEYDHYTLGPHSYLSLPSVMPFVSYVEGLWGLTQLSYRYGGATYLGSPFHELRDGPNETISLSQSLYFEGGRYATVGYEFLRENPDHQSGSDYDALSNEVFVGGGLPLWFGVFLDALYLYRNDDYTHANSFSGFTEIRQDDGHYFYAGLNRPITEHVSVGLAYYGTINLSNIAVFDYRRNVVAALMQVTY